MKKIAMTMIALMAMTAVSAQNTQKNDTLQFMTAYRQFAAFVVAQPSMTKHMADSLMARQDTLKIQYRKVKPQLTNRQVEEYNTLKGRFTKKMLEYRGNRVTDGIEATGDSIANAAERVGSAVGGFFKGVFKK